MIRRRHVSLILAGCLALFVTSAAWAGAPTDQLKTFLDRVTKSLEDPVLKGDGRVKARRATVRTMANDIFDFSETAKRSLAGHWQDRTDKERQEFVMLFGDLLERSYFSKIDLYGGGEIRYGREEVDGDFATVSTTMMTKQGKEIAVDYRLLRRGDRWLVYDFVVEGVSLISNYRTQFNKAIRTSSYAELVKKLKTKQEESTEGEPKGKGTGGN